LVLGRGAIGPCLADRRSGGHLRPAHTKCWQTARTDGTSVPVAGRRSDDRIHVRDQGISSTKARLSSAGWRP